jgi:glycosyltransferase involved in cell wall biosynthesis
VVSNEPVVEVVVPTHNEERNIARLLASIRSQEGCRYGVVVVDQGSSDRTAEIVRSYGWPVIDAPKGEFYSPPARSRNIGARSTSGRILLHLDADMELNSPSLLKRIAGAVDGDHQAVIIHEHDVASGFWARCKALERSCYWNTDMESARAVTRELFVLVGGYDEEVSSGEDLFITNLYKKHTEIRLDDALVLDHHLGRLSLRRLLAKKYSYGKTAQTYLSKARIAGAGSSLDIVRRSLAAYLKHWRLLLRHPALYLCIFPLRTLELLSLKLGKWDAARNGVATPPRSDTPSPSR